MRFGLRGGVLLAILGLAGTMPAHAQYFGKNPVQWERPRFEVLKTEHFDIYHYAESRKAAEQVGRLAERWYARLSGVFKFKLPTRQPLVIYASQAQFQQTSTLGEAPGEGTGGVTEAFKRRVILPVGASLADTDHVLGHELVHAFQYAMTGQGKVMVSDVGALNMPLWYIEGMAEYLSVGPVDAHTAMWMRDAALANKLPTISDLAGDRYFPYRYGQALWSYLVGRYGEHVIVDSLQGVGARTTDAEQILKEMLKVDPKTLSKEWQAAIREACKTTTEGKKDASSYGAALVTEKGQGGSLNVGPALSPDGTHLAFLSERDRFSIELFLADAQTGRITRRLSHTARDPHVESLQFINSAGAFDRSGKRFAMAAVAKGRPLLVVLDGASGNTLREVPLPTLGEIATPSFAPDGERIVFSALVEGVSDLYIYDLGKSELTRLTNDAFADLQPAWSPDGTRIAFVSDRFTTRLATLSPGESRLATIDPVTLEIEPLPSFEHAKNINPQWASSGKSLYFLSDRAGITNIYRLDVGAGSLSQVTDLKTGVSGITSESPALSTAGATDRLAYTVFAKEKYEIYTISDAQALLGKPVVPAEAQADVALIPGARATGRIDYARFDESGLPDPATFKVGPYKASLGLDYVGQPYVAAGVSRSGRGIAGGISMAFSDMLGEHNLQTEVQAQAISGFNDLGAIAQYVNRRHRLNWGVAGGQVPYIYSSFGSSVVQDASGPIYAEQEYQDRQIERSAAILGYYPFDSSLRVEAQAGYRHIGFSSRVQTDYYDYVSGAYIGQEKQNLPGSTGLGLFEGTLALVRDTSVFGATSPVMGHRFRLEVAPTTGDIDYVGTLVDYRQYVMPVRPVTIAGRLLHYARWGTGADDTRMYPLFLGDPGFVRGYGATSFDLSECGNQANGSCPRFDQLLGSRMLMANLEVRAPLLGLLGAKSLYGPVPVEVGAFFDAGVTWDRTTKPTIFGGTRDIVRSLGAVARLNLLGFAVFEVDYVKPLDRPGRGMLWQFNLLAGF